MGLEVTSPGGLQPFHPAIFCEGGPSPSRSPAGLPPRPAYLLFVFLFSLCHMPPTRTSGPPWYLDANLFLCSFPATGAIDSAIVGYALPLSGATIRHSSSPTSHRPSSTVQIPSPPAWYYSCVLSAVPQFCGSGALPGGIVWLYSLRGGRLGAPGL
jgi:hypothetical protein